MIKKKVLFIHALLLAFALNVAAQQPSQQPPRQPAQQTPPKAPIVDRSKLPLSQRQNLTLADVNPEIAVDKRVILMMAALNLAGYDYEPGGRQLSALR